MNNALSLRMTIPADAARLMEIFSNGDVVRYTNFKQFNDIDSLNTFLDRFLNIGAGQPLQYGPYSIRLGEVLVGLCGLQQKELALGTAELWYILGKEHWGKGFAKQAVVWLLKESSSNKRLRSIYAEAVGSNEPSWRILEKMGFIQTGELKNGFQKEDIIEDLRSYSFQVR
jgi:ribosomal-protein-alanine N-acetyltransferase